MMLGGVGYQVGLDEAHRKQAQARHAAADAASVPDIVGQLHALKALLDDGVLTPEEFALAKRKVLR